MSPLSLFRNSSNTLLSAPRAPLFLRSFHPQTLGLSAVRHGPLPTSGRAPAGRTCSLWRLTTTCMHLNGGCGLASRHAPGPLLSLPPGHPAGYFALTHDHASLASRHPSVLLLPSSSRSRVCLNSALAKGYLPTQRKGVQERPPTERSPRRISATVWLYLLF